LDACVKETLRLIPPSPNLFLRKATEDHQIDNLTVKAGTIVNISISSLSSGKGLSDEKSFVPERWLNGETDILNPLHRIPFSIGPRNCIG
jgi:cytochrome P450